MDEFQRFGMYRVTRIFNLIIGCFLIVLGIYRYAVFEFSSNYTYELFIPFYIMVSGSLVLVAEIKSQSFLNNFKFMSSFFGRGVFNIYIATMIFQVYKENNEERIIGFVAFILIVIFGLIYIFIHIFKVFPEIYMNFALNESFIKKTSIEKENDHLSP